MHYTAMEDVDASACWYKKHFSPMIYFYQLVLEFRTEFGMINTVSCTKLWNNLTTEIDVMVEQDCARFDMGVSF